MQFKRPRLKLNRKITHPKYERKNGCKNAYTVGFVSQFKVLK